MNLNNEVLDDQGAADYLKVPLNSIRYYRSSGRLKYFRVGKHPRIYFRDLLAFIKESSDKITPVVDGQKEQS